MFNTEQSGNHRAVGVFLSLIPARQGGRMIRLGYKLMSEEHARPGGVIRGRRDQVARIVHAQETRS